MGCMTINTVILLIAYGLTIWFFRRWIKSGSFKNVTLTPKRMRTIAFRTALLYLFLGFLCWYFKLNALKLLAMIVIISLVLLISGCGLLGSGVLAFIPIVIYYVLFQWLLGFPDKDLWIPPNKKYKHHKAKLTHLIGKTGHAETILRPTGEILIDGQKHVATSEIDFIEKGTSVSVIAIKNNTLIVCIGPIKKHSYSS